MFEFENDNGKHVSWLVYWAVLNSESCKTILKQKHIGSKRISNISYEGNVMKEKGVNVSIIKDAEERGQVELHQWERWQVDDTGSVNVCWP